MIWGDCFRCGAKDEKLFYHLYNKRPVCWVCLEKYERQHLKDAKLRHERDAEKAANRELP